MSKVARLIAVVAILAIVAAACGGDDEGGDTTGPTGESGPSGETGGIPRGGTVKFGLVGDVASGFDPQKEYYQLSFEYFSCCLLRALYATNGSPVDQGGAELRPDIASAEPSISEDGLTWTFPLKTGIFYSPPLQDVEVTAQDFIRALERTADPKASIGGYSFYYSAIEGFDEFSSGEADSIAGLSAPDDQTLVVTTSAPTGDLAWRLAMPSAAPIAPNPDDPSARLGIAEGHTKDYGRFLVGTGPVHVRGHGSTRLLAPARRAGAELRVHPWAADRPGAQPVVGPGNGRAATGVRGSAGSLDRRRRRRPVQPGGVRRPGLRRGRQSTGRRPPAIQHRSGSAAVPDDVSAERAEQYLDEPGRRAVRRHPRAEGGQLRDR